MSVLLSFFLQFKLSDGEHFLRGISVAPTVTNMINSGVIKTNSIVKITHFTNKENRKGKKIACDLYMICAHPDPGYSIGTPVDIDPDIIGVSSVPAFNTPSQSSSSSMSPTDFSFRNDNNSCTPDMERFAVGSKDTTNHYTTPGPSTSSCQTSGQHSTGSYSLQGSTNRMSSQYLFSSGESREKSMSLPAVSQQDMKKYCTSNTTVLY